MPCFDLNFWGAVQSDQVTKEKRRDGNGPTVEERVAESEPDEPGVLRSDDILAAYRARREANARISEDAKPVKEVPEEVPESPPTHPPEPQEPPEPGSDASEEQEKKDAGAPEARAPEPPVEPTGPEALPRKEPPQEPPEQEPEPAVVREAPVARYAEPVAGNPPALAVPRGSPLTALQPGMGLADRLLSDATVTVRGNILVRGGAAVAALLGLLVLVVERRSARLADTTYYVSSTGVPVAFVGWFLAIVGAAVFVTFLYYPPARTLRVKLAADQQSEWRRVQDEAKILHLLHLLGMGLLGGGLLLAILAYAAFPKGQLAAGAFLGIMLAGIGAVLAVVALSRRGAVHRLYIQTLILSRLEQTGLGVPGNAPDDRVAPVLLALDKLLGHLPESAVRGFLQSELAQPYLDLVDEARDG